ncbi:hypothetical protein D9619_002314 [Psilocybe cf. subviscida]|uniref:Uncharacterized protein n=1 Tax=Psilocybe cf. subviscida TaxID=2480587 RepID=A0A8H5AWE5_9AGAR|nr:hypothetical protein D9619_002314 [Psilocybe cf. subviscida]
MPSSDKPRKTVRAEDGTVLERHVCPDTKGTTLGHGTVILISEEDGRNTCSLDTAFRNSEDLTITGGFYGIGAGQTARHYLDMYGIKMAAEEKRAQEAHELDMAIKREQLARLKRNEQRPERAQNSHAYNGHGYVASPGLDMPQVYCVSLGFQGYANPPALGPTSNSRRLCAPQPLETSTQQPNFDSSRLARPLRTNRQPGYSNYSGIYEHSK